MLASGDFRARTERHESRRIDNQLRGRSGCRATRDFTLLPQFETICCDFGPKTMFVAPDGSSLEDGEALPPQWMSKAIETAQKKVEARNYDVRKQVVEYEM